MVVLSFAITLLGQDAIAGTPLAAPACTGVPVPSGTDLRSAVSKNPPGTTFCLSGLHRQTTYVIPKSGDIFIGQPGATLNGSKIITFAREGRFWAATGQTQQNPQTNGTCRPQSYQGCRYPDAVYLDSKPLWRVMTLSELTPGSFYFDYSADKIYVADDPTGHMVEAAVAPLAFKSWQTGVIDVLIRGLTIEKFANAADVGAIEATNWTVENNEVRLNHGIGIAGAAFLRGNYIHDNGKLGLYSAHRSGNLVENNTISRNNWASFAPTVEAGGAKWSWMTSLTVRGNTVVDNIGPGLWTDWNNRHILYENNTVLGNAQEGIFHEAGYNAIIRNNIVRANGFGTLTGWLDGAGILVNSSPNVEIYGNVVDRNWNGIGLTQTNRGAGPYGPRELTNVLVHDNVVTMARGYTGLAVGVPDASYFTARGNRFYKNTYYAGCNRTYFAWRGYVTTQDWFAAGNDSAGRVHSIC